MSVGAYLDAYLQTLAPWLDQSDVTDLFINGPGAVWVERLGGAPERHAAPVLTEVTLWRLATQIAAATHQGISREHPLLSAELPSGARVQIVAPPACRDGVAMAIRKQVVRDLTLDDYVARGAFAPCGADGRVGEALDDTLARRLASGDVASFLRSAVRGRRNILISGGASTGKTTFLNALVKEIPVHERLVTIEDTPEVQLPHENRLGLIAVRGGQGEARVEAVDLLQACLRLRPDRIILGELRGSEAFSFLRAVNSGHPGSITTVHADSPAGAIDQIALMVLQSGAQLGRAEIIDYVRRVIDVSVQLGRQDGRRIVTAVEHHRR
jgi:type IV secretion system protein VirB11